MNKQGRLPEDRFLDQFVIPGCAWLGAWQWSQSFKARSGRMDFQQRNRLATELTDVLKPWAGNKGGHEDFLIKEHWDKGTANTLGKAFAHAAPKYARDGALHHHIDILAEGIVASSSRGLHATNRNLSVVFGCLLPPVLHPKIWGENRRTWGTYYDHLVRFMDPDEPQPDGRTRPHSKGLPIALREGIAVCDKHKLWPHPAVRDEIVGLLDRHQP